MTEDIAYKVPSSWYKGVYHDEKTCRKSARSFALKHEKKTEECWILIHGYRGYPGEMVRPAVDLYKAGFDVYVPRLPGHGTSKNDFIKSGHKDWIKTAQNALNDLEKKYKKVNLVGHSMGTAIASIVASNNTNVGKVVYASPSYKNLQLGFIQKLYLGFLSIFTPTVKCGWKPDTRFHLHYENAPCDDNYLGKEYWQFYFTKQLLSYSRVMNLGAKSLKQVQAKQLVIYPLLDKVISKPSVEIIKRELGKKAKITEINNGTHLVFYDKDPQAEEKAVKAVIDFARS